MLSTIRSESKNVWPRYNIAMQNEISNPEPDAADKGFFQRLRLELEHQISSYVYEVHPDAIGSPLSADVIRGYLNSMRLCLVEPRWEEVNICNSLEGSRVTVRRMCVTMAEDGDYVLVFDPIDQEYHLAWRNQRGLGLGTWGIHGDGVECFIAR